MARYFFDIHDGGFFVDDVGVDCSTFDDVRMEAKKTLPAMAKDLLPDEGDQHTIRVIVRDESDVVVYTATLIFSGQTPKAPRRADLPSYQA